MSCTKSKKGYWNQSIGEGWKKETCREEEEKETVGVFEKALKQGFSRGYHVFGEC